LILFYGLTKEELAGNRPLAKFLSIKLIVMFTFYQSFVVSRTFLVPPCSRSVVALVLVKFNVLKGRVIHGTEFWTATNIADGLNALAVCIEAWIPLFPGSCSVAYEYADDIFLVLHDVGFQLEHLSGETRRAPHKHLATTLGLDKLMYAVYSILYPRSDTPGDYRGLCRRNRLRVGLFRKTSHRPAPTGAYWYELWAGVRRGGLSLRERLNSDALHPLYSIQA